MHTFDRDRRQSVLLTVSQMAEADRLSVVAGVSSFALMSNAGAAVAHEIQRRWTPRPLVVLCGPGNNGGDGFVTAHRLAEAGWPVTLAMWGNPSALKGEAKQHAQRWQGAVHTLSPAVLEGAELIVDAVFGAGLARALQGPVLDTLTAAGRGNAPIIAIDIPSGVMGDTGESLGAVAAVLTVTFFRKKPGHLLQPGRALCGDVVVADIGTPETVLDTLVPQTYENHPRLWLSDLPPIATQDRAPRCAGALPLDEDEFRQKFAFSGDSLTRTRAAAQSCSRVVVLEGRDTVIAAPDGQAIINSNTPSNRAGASVVSGSIIHGLQAQGMPALSAAAAGMWLHGVAIAEFGPGFSAEEWPAVLPVLLRGLVT
ncbi:Bifunctional NAD(P)H-hydrate repair enzyme Nnr [Pseudomonas extremaustralis]|uniref:NAD(P)H-hydrate epimerase n=1 Tax=Pseudomonas extremaustralis TaxID=359110 RepID=A0A5M9J1M0_9PSED|nr:NAD(P)H-hydrate epimerase [Pseudomonas extremaustralis]KAA8562954.1 Bifunctional NAD(P)H-hydrate repair enzyme Nnr [Pseudomonas extremaustralis]